MSDGNEALLRRWFDEVWNEKRVESIGEFMTDESVHHGIGGPGGEPVKGIEAFRQFHLAILEAFPDIEIKLEEVIAKGDKVAARFTATGTHRGPLMEMPPTGKKTEFSGGGICTMRDGKFVEVWNQIDFMKMQYDLADGTPDIK